MATRALPEEAARPPVPVPAPPGQGGGVATRVARTTRFILARRLYLPHYWVMALRYLRIKLFLRDRIRTTGFVFIERGVELYARKGHGRLMLGRWCYFGRGNHIRCHEGNVRIGEKCVFGKDNTINGYLDIEIGPDCLFADWVYVCDFDHRYEDPAVPIRKQGIVKSPVRIGSNCWIGEKTTVLRGVTVGDGSVVASHALVNKDVPPNSVVGGVPARVLKRRGRGSQRA